MGKVATNKSSSGGGDKKPEAFYAVAAGRATGIYKKWDDCKIQITGFKNPKYKKFGTEKEAKEFLTNQGINLQSTGSEVEAAVAEISCTDNNDAGGGGAGIEKQGTGKLANYLVDSEGYVVVYVDGSCRANGKEDSLGGIGVWFGTDEHNLNVSQRLKGRQTYNSSKIQAATAALGKVKDASISKVVIKTDSEYVVNCGTKWIEKWKVNDWKTGAGEEVKNRKEVEELAKAMENVQIKWVYVTGKQNVEGSQQAKLLATEGSKLKI